MRGDGDGNGAGTRTRLLAELIRRILRDEVRVAMDEMIDAALARALDKRPDAPRAPRKRRHYAPMILVAGPLLHHTAELLRAVA